MKITLNFTECEHDGDLDNYTDDLIASGATILDKQVDTDAEEGTVEIEVLNFERFKERFVQTESYEYSQYAEL